MIFRKPAFAGEERCRRRDFTPDRVRGRLYVATWQGFVHIAFVIDTVARRIVDWRVSRPAATGFALEQALYDRRPFPQSGLVHHDDRGSQYVSIRYAERLAAAGIEPSVGSVGDSGACPRAGKAGPEGQRSRRDGHRPVQDGGDPPPRPLAPCRRPAPVALLEPGADRPLPPLARGEPHKPALAACARKLLVHANTILARGTPLGDKSNRKPMGCYNG